MDWLGQRMTPVRRPVNPIRSPAAAPVHAAIAWPLKQPTTVPPSRICSRTRTLAGFAPSWAVIVHRQASPTLGAFDEVVNFACTSARAEVAATRLTAIGLPLLPGSVVLLGYGLKISETIGKVIECRVNHRTVRFFVANANDEVQNHHSHGVFLRDRAA